jgi:quercetin dioxygenase-like cupin family protein
MSGYFNERTRSDAAMYVIPSGELPAVELTTGITAEVLLGERMNVNVVTLAPGAVAPEHTHDEEQMGYIVTGSCDFFDGSQSHRLEPGDTYHAPPGAPHGARAHEDGCVIIDAFSPPRAGLDELLAKAAGRPPGKD